MESTLEHSSVAGVAAAAAAAGVTSAFYSNPSVVVQRSSMNSAAAAAAAVVAQMSQYHSQQQQQHHHHHHHSSTSHHPHSHQHHGPPLAHGSSSSSTGHSSQVLVVGSSVSPSSPPAPHPPSNCSFPSQSIFSSPAAADASPASVAQGVAASLRAAAALGHHLRSGSLPPGMLHPNSVPAPHHYSGMSSMAAAAAAAAAGVPGAHLCNSILLDRASQLHQHHHHQQSAFMSKRMIPSERSSSLSPSSTDGDNSITDAIVSVSDENEEAKISLSHHHGVTYPARGLITGHFQIGLGSGRGGVGGGKVDPTQGDHAMHHHTITGSEGVGARGKKQRGHSKSVSILSMK